MHLDLYARLLRTPAVPVSGTAREPVLSLGLWRGLRADGVAGARARRGEVFVARVAGNSQRLDHRPRHAVAPIRREASFVLLRWSGRQSRFGCHER